MKQRNQGQVYVRCPGRQVYEKIVQLAPVCIFYQLLECVACHTTAPYHRRIRVNKEPYRQHLHPVLLYRFDERAPPLFHRNGTAVLGMEHLRHTRPVNVRVKQPHTLTLPRQRNSQVGGNR